MIHRELDYSTVVGDVSFCVRKPQSCKAMFAITHTPLNSYRPFNLEFTLNKTSYNAWPIVTDKVTGMSADV